jgi:hypothetical protein
MDSCSSSKIEVVDQMIENHYLAYRSDQRYKASWPQNFIESQMSYLEADRVAKLIMQPRFQPVAIESRDPKGLQRFGVPTGKNEKILYCDRLYTALVNEKLHFSHDLICPHSSRQRVGPDVDALKESLRKQLNNFRREVEAPSNPETGTYKVHYTGKAGGLKDDLVMALGMLLYWAQLKQTTDKQFRENCMQKGFTF